MNIKAARQKYASHKWQAKNRNIVWLFTFESWIQMWLDSGKWEERGNKGHQYCMARKGDQGPYSPHNVIIKTTNENKAECRALGNNVPPPSRLGKKNGPKWHEAITKINTPERADKISKTLKLKYAEQGSKNKGRKASPEECKRKSEATKLGWIARKARKAAIPR